MGRQKKVSKPKEPVRIRQRKLKNGNISLYLDIYSDGVRKNIGVAEPWHQTMGENQAGEYATADLALQI